MTCRAARLTLARGARHAEELLLRAVLEHVERDPLAVLDSPLQIVVPSQSLRLHVMRRLVESARSSLLGIRCHTHFGLALRVLDALDETPPRGLDLFPILARRFARREDALNDALDTLREGYNGILPAVRDLLDAGFDPAHLEAIEEMLADDGEPSVSTAELERARAVARVSARTLVAFEELGVGRTSTLFQAATEGVKRDPGRALSASGVLLHGFADATGVTTDFLTALVEAYGGGLVLDRPPDPVRPEREDPSVQFTLRLSERFEGFTDLAVEPPQSDSSRIELIRALGEESEVREVAQRCHDLIEAGTRPESIGIVMRDPRPYRSTVCRLFTDLALPFSAHGLTAAAGPVERRVRAWIEIISQGTHCHVERWLDTMPTRVGGVPLFDLRVALAALGVSRLEQLRRLEIDDLLVRGAYPLPVRQGFSEAEEEAEQGPEQGAQPEARRLAAVRSQRRRVPATALATLIEAGTALCGELDSWPDEPIPLDEHVEHLGRVIEVLGWKAESGEARHLEDLFTALREAPPLAIDRQELILTVRRLASEIGRESLGGRGGGVQVMGVIEARGLTFEHLFVLGLNRGVFPRTVREDPVLSDALRKRLERGGHGLLPDLPIKRRGYQEERFLFAQLLSSAPHVTLSWRELDDDDRPMAPSPLIERLRWSHASETAGWKEPPVAGRRAILDRDRSPETIGRRLARLPVREQLVLAALEGERERLPALLATALDRADRERGSDEHGRDGLDWGRVGRSRTAVIDELDPPTRAEAENCLSPYLGFIGPTASGADPRADRRIWVTTVERMATCPWQTFLERLLRVEAVPDPLEALPRIDPLLIGIVVHGVLERIVGSAVEADERNLRALDLRSPKQVSWPDLETLERLLDEQALQAVRAAGVALDGFSRALVAVARPYLAVARRIEWGRESISTLGAEISGSLAVGAPTGPERQISFRADRVDREEEEIVLVDYKTGASPFTQQGARYRYERYLADLAAGSRLQPAVYAAAVATAPADGPGGRGRFSFLRPDLDAPEAARWVTVSGSDTEVRERLDRVLETVLEAWDRGLFFPRLELPEGIGKAPPACQWCRVAEACLRQDSGSRRRLRLGMERLRSRSEARGGRTLGAGDRAALLEHWWLATPAHRPDDLTPEER